MKRFSGEEISIMYHILSNEKNEWRRTLINAEISENTNQAIIAREKMTQIEKIKEKLFEEI